MQTKNGEFFFTRLQTGEITIEVSLMGYVTQTAEINIHDGLNEMNFILKEHNIKLDPVTVIAQKREQQLLDVPNAISVVGKDLIEKLNITELGQLSNLSRVIYN